MDQLEKSHNNTCVNCTIIKEPSVFPCHVCERKMCFYKCNTCDTVSDIIDVCSPKCKQILNGEAHLVPIQYEHKTVMVIEDFDDILGLKVIDHFLLNQILTDTQKEKMNKECSTCKEEKYRLLPYKCSLCKESYTYEVECGHCYDGEAYICDDCENLIDNVDITN